MMDRGCEIAEALQVAIDTKVLDVRPAKHHGNMYSPGSVVCLKVLNEMPVFHVVLKDERLLLFTFALQTVFMDDHFYAFKLVCTADGPHVVDVKELLRYRHAIFRCQSNDDSNSCIIPCCFL